MPVTRSPQRGAVNTQSRAPARGGGAGVYERQPSSVAPPSPSPLMGPNGRNPSKGTNQYNQLYASDDDLQQEMARARVGAGRRESPAQQRPGSAIPSRSTSNAPNGATPGRAALVVPSKPSGVVLGRTPSQAPVASGAASRASSNVRQQPSSSSVSAPARVNAEGAKSVLPASNSNAARGVPLQAPLVRAGNRSAVGAGVFAKDRPRLAPPVLDDDDGGMRTPPRGGPNATNASAVMTPDTRQQHQWMDILNYVDAVTIAITHRSKTAPPIPRAVGEAWGDTIGPMAGHDAIVGGGVPLSLGGFGPSARSPRNVGQRGISDLHRSVGGLLHWFSLLELRHMPDGTTIADADRNLQLLGQDVRTNLKQVQESLLEAAAKRGSQSLAFVKSQSAPSFDDCEHTLARLLCSGKGLGAIRDLVAKRDADRARAVIAEHKRYGNGTAAAGAGRGTTTLTAAKPAPKASPSKFQQKRAIPSPSRAPHPSSTPGAGGTMGNGTLATRTAALKAAFDPSLPIYPPTLIDWLEKQWLPAVDDWFGILSATQEQFRSPVATREGLGRYVSEVEADVIARQHTFQEMLLPGESLPRMVQALIVSPGQEAAKAAGRRDESFRQLKAALDGANFVELAAKLKEVKDKHRDEAALSAEHQAMLREGQRLLLNMQHVAKVTMGLTSALGGSGPSGTGASARAAEVKPLVKALTAANQTLLDLRLASDLPKCEQVVNKGCTLLLDYESLAEEDNRSTAGIPADRWLAYLRGVSAPDLVVAHVPSGAWPAELTLLYQRAATALQTAVEREVTRFDMRRQLQKHLPVAGGGAAASSAPRETTPSQGARASRPKSPSVGVGAKPSVAGVHRRSGSTSTDLGPASNSLSPPTRLPPSANGPHDPHQRAETESVASTSVSRPGHGTVAIEALRALISRSKQLGMDDGLEMQQLQRVLESATELRLKIHFDSNIRVLGLAMERVEGGVSASGGATTAISRGRSPSQSTPRAGSLSGAGGGPKARYEPPSFERAFDRIYTFCTGTSSQQAKGIYYSPQGVNFRIRYQDPDGDYITVASEEDWRVLLSDHYRGALQQGQGGRSGAAGRKIEIYCDVPPLPQYQQQQQGAGGNSQQPQAAPRTPNTGGPAAFATPYRAQSFVPTTAAKAATPASGMRDDASAGAGGMGIRGRGVGAGATSNAVPSASPTPPPTTARASDAAPPPPGRGFTVQHTNAPSSRQGREPTGGSGGGRAGAQIASTPTVNSGGGTAAMPIPARPNDALNELMRRDQSAATPTNQNRGPAPQPQHRGATPTRQQSLPLPKGEGGGGGGAARGRGVAVVDVNTTPIRTVDDDGTLSVIEVHDTGNAWGGRGGGGGGDPLQHGGGEDDDAYDIRTMHSVATTAIIEEARRMAAGNTNAKGGRNGSHASAAVDTTRGAQRLAAIGELPARRSRDVSAVGVGAGLVPPQSVAGAGRGSLVPSQGRAGSSHASRSAAAPSKGRPQEMIEELPPLPPPHAPAPVPVAVAPIPLAVPTHTHNPRTWQEEHGDDYDVHTIMSEETTVTMVQRRAEVKRGVAPTGGAATPRRGGGGVGATPQRGRDASPSTTAAKKKPLSHAELVQRRAELLAQLRRQKPGGGGDGKNGADDLSVGNVRR